MDPLRKRPTTFSRSTADPSASGGADKSWTETPAERRQRVADEMAGIKRKDPDQAKKQTQGSDFGTKRRRDEEIREEVDRYSVRFSLSYRIPLGWNECATRHYKDHS